MRAFPTEDTVTRSKKPFVFTFSFFLSSIFLRFNLPPSIHISFIRVFVFLRFLLYFCCDFCPDSLAQARSRSIRSFLLLLLSLVFFFLCVCSWSISCTHTLSLSPLRSMFLSFSHIRTLVFFFFPYAHIHKMITFLFYDYYTLHMLQ